VRKRVRQQPASLSFQPASSKERVQLENLAQFYSCDFSEMLEMYVDEDGRFGDVDLTPYWVDEWRHPFLLRVDDKLAGFALISERSKITRRTVLDTGSIDSATVISTSAFVCRRSAVRSGNATSDASRPAVATW
jgi:hypothetical protein